MPETVQHEGSHAATMPFRWWRHLAGAGSVAISTGIVMSVAMIVGSGLRYGFADLGWFVPFYSLMLWTVMASLPALLGWLPLNILLYRPELERLPRGVRGAVPGAGAGLAAILIPSLAGDGFPGLWASAAIVLGGVVVGLAGYLTTRSALTRTKPGIRDGVLMGMLVLPVVVAANHFVRMALTG